MTTLLDRNRVLDASTWGEVDCYAANATQRLVDACAAAEDGVVYAWRPRWEHVWDSQQDKVPGVRRVRIAIPALTAESGIVELAELTRLHDFRVTRLVMRNGLCEVRVEGSGGVGYAAEPEAWRAINMAFWRLRNR